MDSAPARSWILRGDTPHALGATDTVDILRAVGRGVYEGFRTYDGTRVFRFGAHALRLESGRAQFGLGIPIDLAALGHGLGRILDELHAENSSTDWKVRIDHAETDLSGIEPSGEASRIVVQAWPWRPVPAQVLEQGANCALEHELQREDPRIKGTAFSLRRMQTTFPGNDNYESILVSPTGDLLEGVMSGLGLVVGNELWTAGAGVLPSLTIESACKLAESAEVIVRREALKRADLSQVQEAFLASSARGLIPIRCIDGAELRSAGPGELTLKLRAMLEAIEKREARRPDNR